MIGEDLLQIVKADAVDVIDRCLFVHLRVLVKVIVHIQINCFYSNFKLIVYQ